MTIKTQYNIGDEVWYLRQGKSLSGQVIFIILEVLGNGVIHQRYILTSSFGRAIKGDGLFSSKEELIYELTHD